MYLAAWLPPACASPGRIASEEPRTRKRQGLLEPGGFLLIAWLARAHACPRPLRYPCGSGGVRRRARPGERLRTALDRGQRSVVWRRCPAADLTIKAEGSLRAERPTPRVRLIAPPSRPRRRAVAVTHRAMRMPKKGSSSQSLCEDTFSAHLHCSSPKRNKFLAQTGTVRNPKEAEGGQGEGRIMVVCPPGCRRFQRLAGARLQGPSARRCAIRVPCVRVRARCRVLSLIHI